MSITCCETHSPDYTLAKWRFASGHRKKKKRGEIKNRAMAMAAQLIRALQLKP